MNDRPPQPPGTEPRGTQSHDEWDELAAGYALHALEPDEQVLFTRHLRGCAQCEALLRDHELVAAQLGSLAHDEDGDLPTPTWNAIRSRVVDAPAPATVASLADRQRRRRHPWLLGAAAAGVVLAGAGIIVWQTSGTTTSPATRAVQTCQHEPGCSVVRLHASHGADPAVVLVSDNRVTLVPMAMKAPAAGRTYVLWQLLRTGGPTAVDAFRNTASTDSAPLVMPYGDTAAFAVSLEPAGLPPSQPTQVLAVGNTTA